MKPFILAVALLALTIALRTPDVAGAAGFNQFIAFGDSNLDTGYFRYHTTGTAALDQALAFAIANGATGGYSGNGVMNTTLLAQKFGLKAAPVDGGGTNYANGGATTVVNDQPVLPANVSTIQQIENYLSSVNGVANPNALYIIKTGDNDVTYVINQGATWIAEHPEYLGDAASALAAEVTRLQAAGARTIIVPNSYTYPILAGLGGDIPSENADAYALSQSFGTIQWASLTAAGVRFIPADYDSLFRYVVKNPTLFGFTAESVLASSSPSSNSAAVAIRTPAEQQSYLFIDGKHMTTAGQTIVADYIYSLLIAPNQVSLLAESAVYGGLSRTAAIQRQIELSGQHRGPRGINVWAASGANSLKIRNESSFPDSSGAPFGGSVGADYQTQGGHFDQVEEAPSIYAAYKAGPI
jgi:outer membrane lipase/esterase